MVQNMRSIRYVDANILVDIPHTNLIFDIAPGEVRPAPDSWDLIRVSLTNPIGTPPLREMLRPGQSVVLIVDDNTRQTPTKQILPTIVGELNQAGIPNDDIRAVIASGTHRPMTQKEKIEKYGNEMLSRIRFLDHDYKDPTKLVDYGTTTRGTRILVNRDVVQSDFRIAIGNIIPHYPTGWSAGAKAVLPGVAGEETVAQMHFLGCRAPALGEVNTPMRMEMEDFAAKIGLSFILNTILNREGQLVNAVAGHFVSAHRAGVKISQAVYGQPISGLADLTISSTSPIDFDLFQADKGISSAELATKLGGEIILVSGCIEGVSSAHPELADFLGQMENHQIWDLVHRKAVADPLTAAEAIMLNDIREKRKITLATRGLRPELCQRMGFGHIYPDELNDYVRQRLIENPNTEIGILHQSAEILPICTC
jgi:lactate racemase